jgi:hypothetical protein
MDAVTINAKDYVDDRVPVVQTASVIGAAAADALRAGRSVLVSVCGVRGVSSSFFNVILSSVSQALGGDFARGRFDVVTDTTTQRLVYERSLAAFRGNNSTTGDSRASA